MRNPKSEKMYTRNNVPRDGLLCTVIFFRGRNEFVESAVAGGYWRFLIFYVFFVLFPDFFRFVLFVLLLLLFERLRIKLLYYIFISTKLLKALSKA
jgi:hypothetical protein